MSHPADTDTNAAIWQSGDIAAHWAAEAATRERNHAAQWRFMADVLPFGAQDTFTFLDLGAGTGNLARAVLDRHPGATAILADFSAQLIGAGEEQMRPYAGRYEYVEFDVSAGDWPASVPASLDAVVTSLFVHHLPDERKQSLFAEIGGRLVPGGWYLNYDPVRTQDAVVRDTWQRVSELGNPEATRRRLHPTPDERARFENHVRYMTALPQQLGYLEGAGFEGIDVYWKRLEFVIYGGRRPLSPGQQG